MEAWHDLFVASAGAAAALMGLLFVGLSINLSKILAFPLLVDRALLAAMLLLAILIQTLLLLVPHETPHVAGLCTLTIFAISWPGLSYLDLRIFKKTDSVYRIRHLLKMIFDQVAFLPYFIGGLMMWGGSVSGYYWLVGAIIVSFIKASLDAWVLLVEINR
jgi:hypothetical protein